MKVAQDPHGGELRVPDRGQAARVSDHHLRHAAVRGRICRNRGDTRVLRQSQGKRSRRSLASSIRGGILPLEGDVAADAPQIAEEVRQALEAMGSGGARSRRSGIRTSCSGRSSAKPRPAPRWRRDDQGLLRARRRLPAEGRRRHLSPDTLELLRLRFAGLVRQPDSRAAAAGPVDAEASARILAPLRDPRRFTMTRTGNVDRRRPRRSTSSALPCRSSSPSCS